MWRGLGFLGAFLLFVGFGFEAGGQNFFLNILSTAIIQPTNRIRIFVLCLSPIEPKRNLPMLFLTLVTSSRRLPFTGRRPSAPADFLIIGTWIIRKVGEDRYCSLLLLLLFLSLSVEAREEKGGDLKNLAGEETVCWR